MYSSSYSKICNHERTTRLNNDFIRCLSCGQSIVSPQKMIHNKSRQEFTKENKAFNRNFDRNFNNEIEETDMESGQKFEYYTDRNWINNVIIDRTIQFQSFPPKYKVKINGKNAVLTEQQISETLNDIGAIRVDEQQFLLNMNQ